MLPRLERLWIASVTPLCKIILCIRQGNPISHALYVAMILPTIGPCTSKVGFIMHMLHKWHKILAQRQTYTNAKFHLPLTLGKILFWSKVGNKQSMISKIWWLQSWGSKNIPMEHGISSIQNEWGVPITLDVAAMDVLIWDKWTVAIATAMLGKTGKPTHSFY